jgi:mevalonate kinase
MFFNQFILLVTVCTSTIWGNTLQVRPEEEIVRDLFRLRNEHKADSAEQYFADTVKVYMKYLKNVPKKKITQSDKSFWKAHPKNKFEITEPIRITYGAGSSTAIIIGKEYLDGLSFQYEKIEIVFDRNKKIISFRGFNWKKIN